MKVTTRTRSAEGRTICCQPELTAEAITSEDTLRENQTLQMVRWMKRRKFWMSGAGFMRLLWALVGASGR